MRLQGVIIMICWQAQTLSYLSMITGSEIVDVVS